MKKFRLENRKKNIKLSQPYLNYKDDTSYIAVTFAKKTGNPDGVLCPQDKDSTPLQELSLLINTYVGAIHYDIHLDIKLDHTISRFFQEMSLSELETLHRLCEFE